MSLFCMSGHSHWAGIKHRKGINDAKRANIFTKLGRLVTIAARDGEGNPEFNFKLKLAVEQARSANMPKENIEKAIERGIGESKDGVNIQEAIYEAYLPVRKESNQKIAMLIKTATDNKNRTLGEIKRVLAEAGGKLVPSGSVSFMFKQTGFIEIEAEEKNKEELEMKAIDAGADDINYLDGIMIVYTKTENLQKVKENLEKNGIVVKNAGIVYISNQKIKISEETRLDYEKLLEKLDELDDVQEIYDNL